MISDLCAAAFVSLALGCLTRLFYTYWISKVCANRNVNEIMLRYYG
jgi:hypothetical protein